MREFESHLKQFFRSIIFQTRIVAIVKVTLETPRETLNFRDIIDRISSDIRSMEISIDRWAIEMLSDILRIPKVILARKNLAKQAVAHRSFMASRTTGCRHEMVKLLSVAHERFRKSLIGHRHGR